MIKPTLVVMAAGMGSRYGGLKQIDPVGPNNELIIDYSIYDAINAGFNKVVFIIKKENEQLFKETIGHRIEKIIDTEYAFQDISDLPEGFSTPAGREKPWGTAHAVLSCRHNVAEPFAVINADDFYGQSSFQTLHDHLKDAQDKNGIYDYSMVGFILENTLTDHGHVARGICKVDSDGYLQEINERTKIMKFGDVAKYTEDDVNWVTIPTGSIVSMNMWGFTPSIFDEIDQRFSQFLKANQDNVLKAEYFLPTVVDNLISEGKAQVKVLQSNERWYGVTYREDKPVVKKALRQLINNNIYPENLWEDFDAKTI